MNALMKIGTTGKLLILAAVAAAIFVFVGYRGDIGDARERIAIGSRVAATPCGPIEYADAGDGTPLLMIHGAGGGFDQSLAVGRRLVDKGFRLIAPSRFGYLGTPLPDDASPAAQADAHACLLDALGLSEVVVVGASLGAPSTVQFCLRHPQRCAAMVLVVPVLYSPQGPNAFLRQALARVGDTPAALRRSDFLFWLATRVGSKAVTETLIGVPFEELQSASPVERDRIAAMLELALPISARADGLEHDVTLALPRYELERIRAPTLVISVETDLYGTFEIARYTAQEIPAARFLRYRSGGHLWVGHHETMLDQIARFANPSTR